MIDKITVQRLYDLLSWIKERSAFVSNAFYKITLANIGFANILGYMQLEIYALVKIQMIYTNGQN